LLFLTSIGIDDAGGGGGVTGKVTKFLFGFAGNHSIGGIKAGVL
jgi:hypothetical protein